MHRYTFTITELNCPVQVSIYSRSEGEPDSVGSIFILGGEGPESTAPTCPRARVNHGP